jgi:hypothetical protein
VAFALKDGARLLLHPPKGGHTNGAAGFASRYGPLSRSPFKGLLTLGIDPARFQAEPPACYRAPWRLPGRDFHPLPTTSLCSDQVTRSTTSKTLGTLPRCGVISVGGSR